MNVCIVVAFFLLLPFNTKNLVCSKGVCNRVRGEIICCVNYIKVNGTCIICPEGTFGVKCKNSCPQTRFGRGCRYFCNCLINQYCDPVHGCADNTTIGLNSFTSESNIPNTSYVTMIPYDHTQEQNLLFFYLCIGIAACAVVGCSGGMLYIYRKREWSRNEEHRRVRSNFDGSFGRERQEVLPQAMGPNRDEIMPEPEYVEISDVDTTYLEPCSFTAA